MLQFAEVSWKADEGTGLAETYLTASQMKKNLDEPFKLKAEYMQRP